MVVPVLSTRNLLNQRVHPAESLPYNDKPPLLSRYEFVSALFLGPGLYLAVRTQLPNDIGSGKELANRNRTQGLEFYCCSDHYVGEISQSSGVPVSGRQAFLRSAFCRNGTRPEFRAWILSSRRAKHQCRQRWWIVSTATNWANPERWLGVDLNGIGIGTSFDFFFDSLCSQLELSQDFICIAEA